jgi:general stress protein YciG
MQATVYRCFIHQEITMASTDQGNQGGQQQTGKSTRGFASMDPERQRQIASQGGKAAHQKGTAHEFTPEEARQAGSKGGKAAHEKGTAHEFDSQEAREAGRKGGLASGGNQGNQGGQGGSQSGEEGGSH